MIFCHICKGELEFFDSFSNLKRVTSDCRPWNSRGELAICLNCGIVQKPITTVWLNEVAEIYSSYDIFSQSGGSEQSSFNQVTGTGLARSNILVDWLSVQNILSSEGKLLDIGCGKGSFLQAFGSHFSRWDMKGFDLDSREKSFVESIPGVSGLYTGTFEEIEETFDLISLIHSLEHIPNPISYIAALKKNLKPNGFIFIQVPNLISSQFDLLIADHCTHFDPESLGNVIKNAGYLIVKGQADHVPKELSFLSAPTSSNQKLSFSTNLYKKNKEMVLIHLEWLEKLLTEFKSINENVGIFGTSIAGSWLASCLENKVAFFVDEDLSRIGRKHIGINILSPSEVESNKTVLFPMKYESAILIASRLSNFLKKIKLPPQ